MEKDYLKYFEEMQHDPKDPNPWMALCFDRSIPFNPFSKAVFLYDSKKKNKTISFTGRAGICQAHNCHNAII